MDDDDIITSGNTYEFVDFIDAAQAPQQLQVTKEDLQRVTDELHGLSLKQHVMNERLPKITEVFLTPSEFKKSKHKDTFFDLLVMLGMGRQKIVDRVEQYNATLESATLSYQFSFDWTSDMTENKCYTPLLKHLCDSKIHGICVASGEGLPDGLLYHEYLWTLRKNTSVPSSQLRLTGEAPIFKYTLRGRTDIVVVADPSLPVGNHNNRYFIELKRPSDMNNTEECLREAVLQLIGGNASNTFHSPPVLLSNLVTKHYVLFISLIGDPLKELKFKLNVLQMPSFGMALEFVEIKTREMKSETRHLGRKPTPSTSPENKSKIQNENNGSETDIADHFDSVSLDEVVNEDDSYTDKI